MPKPVAVFQRRRAHVVEACSPSNLPYLFTCEFDSQLNVTSCLSFSFPRCTCVLALDGAGTTSPSPCHTLSHIHQCKFANSNYCERECESHPLWSHQRLLHSNRCTTNTTTVRAPVVACCIHMPQSTPMSAAICDNANVQNVNVYCNTSMLAMVASQCLHGYSTMNDNTVLPKSFQYMTYRYNIAYWYALDTPCTRVHTCTR